MSKSVFGIATTHGQAERIVQQLQGQGFATSEISVLMPDTGGTRDVGHVKATKAPEGATTGAAAGGATGGVIGLLAGIGALAIPGVGPFIAAGPIMAALSGAAVGAAAGAMADEYRERGKEVLDDALHRVRSFQDDSKQYVRENPTKAVFTALGVGFVLGLIFRR